MKLETYQKLRELHKGNLKPKVSVLKTIGDYIVVRKSFGSINFKSMEDAEKGIDELLKVGWDIRVDVDGKLVRRKTTKGILSAIKN
jgi:hypothetical protein